MKLNKYLCLLLMVSYIGHTKISEDNYIMFNVDEMDTIALPGLISGVISAIVVVVMVFIIVFLILLR